MNHAPGQLFALLMTIAIFALMFRGRQWAPSRTAFGTASWATDRTLRNAGMLSGPGLLIGRTLGSGKPMWITDYCHTLLVGATGSGKGVSVILPQLLTFQGSVIAFDPKGDLFTTSGAVRARMGHRIIRLAPFTGGRDTLNPLDAIPASSPLLVDRARAIAEALVVRQGTEPDPHWNDKAVQVITCVTVLVLLRFRGHERSLNTVQEIASDEQLLRAAAAKLKEIGGIPARMGSQLDALFAREEE
ncbi:MAG: type IV secretory system conjugative DNA transfer family protein [Planctomycetota bacterium]|nr:type IV secretory system conjugative DNA transfer family protein [Planctomycetota bacterium]